MTEYVVLIKKNSTEVFELDPEWFDVFYSVKDLVNSEQASHFLLPVDYFTSNKTDVSVSCLNGIVHIIT